MSIAGSLQKVVGFVLTIFLGACLVIAWVLTMPLIDCGYYLNEMRRKWLGVAKIDSKICLRASR